MKLAIIYGQDGRIVATSRAVDLKEAGSKFSNAAMLPGQGQRLVEIDLADGLESVPNHELHNDYQIDVDTSKLVKKKEP